MPACALVGRQLTLYLHQTITIIHQTYLHHHISNRTVVHDWLFASVSLKFSMRCFCDDTYWQCTQSCCQSLSMPTHDVHIWASQKEAEALQLQTTVQLYLQSSVAFIEILPASNKHCSSTQIRDCTLVASTPVSLVWALLSSSCLQCTATQVLDGSVLTALTSCQNWL